ncbi:MAG: hypothetical protein N0C88_11415 [Candidatus Thiodiazotropha lotti]|uniref:Uncharacterized protein n=1 Tax=Candidatus Thiodiazotropha lotti TaxID=2792787 RepID=A0A9E4K4H7_9GAMM|nr:hypothetical protein [Candidatus Thiodiazotropha lotti]MCG7928794.1 hypothetical protein [Candidatus Thiodiazotropha lotti]MCG7939441.1 hypothetical protein [Candidatus Thiodiazotropha lotti]MCW4203914.1 hypothetical protein [Candidatus Thiodiazotropha lotti]MCW4218637.1 hypothetical protein [Candidatus Thiodiazotropha lotti]
MEKGDVSKVSFAIIDGCPDLFLAKPPGKIGGGHNFIPTEINGGWSLGGVLILSNGACHGVW